MSAIEMAIRIVEGETFPADEKADPAAAYSGNGYNHDTLSQLGMILAGYPKCQGAVMIEIESSSRVGRCFNCGLARCSEHRRKTPKITKRRK